MMSSRILSEYHDAELICIQVDRSQGTAALKFKLVNETFRAFLLSNVAMFRVNDFVMQNVVSRLYLLEGDDADTSEIAGYLRWVSSLIDTTSFLSDERMEKRIHDVKDGVMKILALEPSKGAEVVVVFKNMEVS